MTEASLIGKTGSLSGRVAPGTLGEVIIEVRGGLETYFARAADGAEVIEKGKQVLVVGTAPGRTVFVTAFAVL